MTTSLRCPVSRNPCRVAYRQSRPCDCGPESRFQARISCCRDDGSPSRSTKGLSWAYRRVSFDRRSIVTTGATAIQDALAHRALAAFRALRRRCSGVMLSARRLPPILPPSRPSSDRIWDLMDLAACAGSAGSGSMDGRSPSNLCTAIKPAWTSSSGSLPDGFRIRYQLGMFGRFASSPWKTKVAHYQGSGARCMAQRIPPISIPLGGGLRPGRPAAAQSGR